MLYFCIAKIVIYFNTAKYLSIYFRKNIIFFCVSASSNKRTPLFFNTTKIPKYIYVCKYLHKYFCSYLNFNIHTYIALKNLFLLLSFLYIFIYILSLYSFWNCIYYSTIVITSIVYTSIIYTIYYCILFYSVYRSVLITVLVISVLFTLLRKITVLLK